MSNPSSHPFIGLIDFARLVIDALEASGAEYMLGGALAVAAWARTGSLRAAFGALLAMGIVMVLWPLGFLRELFFPIRRIEESSLRSAGAG